VRRSIIVGRFLKLLEDGPFLFEFSHFLFHLFLKLFESIFISLLRYDGFLKESHICYINAFDFLNLHVKLVFVVDRGARFNDRQVNGIRESVYLAVLFFGTFTKATEFMGKIKVKNGM